MKRLLSACVLLALSCPAFGQEYQIDKISLADGLSQSSVFVTLQDNAGYLWFGTANGLNRYDGYEFQVFTHNPNNPATLSNDYIGALFEDNQYNLWVGTRFGLNKFVRETETFVRYGSVLGPGSRLVNNVTAIHQDRAGTIWVGTGDGLSFLSANSDSFTHFAAHPTFPSEASITALFEDGQDNLWVGTLAHGLFKITPDRQKVRKFLDPAVNRSKHGLPNRTVTDIIEDDNDDLWLATVGHGLYKLDRDGKQFRRHFFANSAAGETDLPANTINALALDGLGKLWIGTDGGLSNYDIERDRLETFYNDQANPSSLSANSVFSLYVDRSDVIWAGTILGGMNKLTQRNFSHYTIPQSSSTKANLVYAFHEDRDGLIWVGTWRGLVLFDPMLGQILSDHRYAELFAAIGKRLILAIGQDLQGDIWIGTERNGLFRVNVPQEHESGARKGKLSYRNYFFEPDNPGSVGANRFRATYRDRAGTLWLATFGGGLNRYDEESDSFTRYTHDPGDSYSISSNLVRTILEDSAGKFWLGTENAGLNCFDPKSGRFSVFQNEPRNPNSLSHNCVSALYEDDSKNLWVATYGGGLNKFVPEENDFIRFTDTDGLPNNVVYAIVPDGVGNLWLSTNRGLSCFDPQQRTFKNYDMDDGLQSNEFNTGAFLKSRSGTMYFGGVNGFNVFHPEAIRVNPHAPKVVITAFRKLNEPVALPYSGEPKAIEMNHDENLISFEFAALDYTNPGRNEFSYKLEGLDNDWIFCGQRRFASYVHLPAGDYVLRVKGANSDGVWNEIGAAMNIKIHPPWWQTKLFIGSALLLLLCATIAADRRRVSRLGQRSAELEQLVAQRTAALREKTVQLEKQKHLAENARKTVEKQARKLSEINRLKSRFFVNISHEFRTPLTLILGPMERLLNNGHNPETKQVFAGVQRNAHRLLSLITQLLDLAKLESGNMELGLEPTELVSFLKDICLSFSPLTETKGVRLVFEPRCHFLNYMVDRDKLEKVVSNLLSNAFKFTKPGDRIVLRVASASGEKGSRLDRIAITVADTGKGIPDTGKTEIFERFYRVDPTESNRSGAGIGLSLVKELVELHNGSISIRTKVGTGSVFRVVLPLFPTNHEPKKIVESNRDGLGVVVKAAESAIKNGAGKARNTSDQPLLLVIEDASEVRDFIRDSLQVRYAIIAAADGAQGLKLAQERIPDIIISDVAMPQMDGFELCQVLKSKCTTSHIPLILLTARAESRDRVSGYNLGADDYLTKPFKMVELDARLQNLLTQRQRLQKHYRKQLLLEPNANSSLSSEEIFLQRLRAVVHEKHQKEEFTANALAADTGLSLRQLQRKIRALTGQSPNQFIRSLRLQYARQFLQNGTGSVSEVAFQVGFSSLSYFSRCFREEFGFLPSELNNT